MNVKLLTKDFDVIVAMNIFAHTNNPLEILLGIKECLKDTIQNAPNAFFICK